MNTKIRVSDLLLNYILLMATLANYVENISVWYALFLVFFGIAILLNKKLAYGILKSARSLPFLAVLLFLSFLVSRDNKYTFDNLMRLMVPLLVVISLVAMAHFDLQKFKNDICEKTILLNFWWVINLVVLGIQLTGVPFMIKQSWLNKPHMYEDLCCGLFGFNRTHELAFFSCMILICNLSYAKRKNHQFRIRWYAYTAITEILMLVFSIYNDNSALFILMPTVLFLYIILQNIKSGKRISNKIIQMLKYILFVCILLAVVYSIPSVREFIDGHLTKRINVLINFKTQDSYASNERIADIAFAFLNSSTWFVGKGIGTEQIGEHVAHGFLHFGISSIGITLYLCGIWFFCIYISILSRSCVSLLCSTKEKKWLLTIIALGILLFFAFYSPIFISVASLVWIMLIFAFI